MTAGVGSSWTGRVHLDRHALLTSLLLRLGPIGLCCSMAKSQSSALRNVLQFPGLDTSITKVPASLAAKISAQSDSLTILAGWTRLPADRQHWQGIPFQKREAWLVPHKSDVATWGIWKERGSVGSHFEALSNNPWHSQSNGLSCRNNASLSSDPSVAHVMVDWHGLDIQHLHLSDEKLIAYMITNWKASHIAPSLCFYTQL